MDLFDKKLWILDMDGTIYLGNRLFNETIPFLERVRASGGRFLFFTNNASRSRSDYVRRLQDMGIPCSAEDILTSAETTLLYLKKTLKQNESVYLIGTPVLEETFRQEGIPLHNDVLPPLQNAYAPFDTSLLHKGAFSCAAVVASFDITLTYEKLYYASALLRLGAAFLATHPDQVCPVEGGFIPDAGSITRLLTSATGKEPRYFGKPYRDVLSLIEAHTGIRQEDMVVVGDRMYTDIALGFQNGVPSVLVLSGETTREDLAKSQIRPDVVVQNVGELLRS